MDIASSFVVRHGRIIEIAIAALILSGLGLLLLAVCAEVLGAWTVGPLPDTRSAPFRWRPVPMGLA